MFVIPIVDTPVAILTAGAHRPEGEITTEADSANRRKPLKPRLVSHEQSSALLFGCIGNVPFESAPGAAIDDPSGLKAICSRVLPDPTVQDHRTCAVRSANAVSSVANSFATSQTTAVDGGSIFDARPPASSTLFFEAGGTFCVVVRVGVTRSAKT